MHAELHDLGQELPEHAQTIHRLRGANAQFAKLFEDYNEIDREVCRIEQHLVSCPDILLQDFKKKRLALKDELFAMILAEETAAAGKCF